LQLEECFAKGRVDRGTTFFGSAGALQSPLITTRSVLREQHPVRMASPGNVGAFGSDYQFYQNLHLSSSRGNFSWVTQGVGLSHARTALSASASLLSSVIADNVLY